MTFRSAPGLVALLAAMLAAEPSIAAAANEFHCRPSPIEGDWLVIDTGFTERGISYVCGLGIDGTGTVSWAQCERFGMPNVRFGISGSFTADPDGNVSGVVNDGVDDYRVEARARDCGTFAVIEGHVRAPNGQKVSLRGRKMTTAEVDLLDAAFRDDGRNPILDGQLEKP